MSWSISAEGSKAAVVERVTSAVPSQNTDAESFGRARETILSIIATLDPNANGLLVDAGGHADYVNKINVQTRYFTL